MSLRITTVMALLLCALVIGCGPEPEPITSKATNYEVADDSADAATPQTPLPESSDFQAAASPNRADEAAVTEAEVPPRRPAPVNRTPAADSNLPDTVQPTPEQLLAVIRRLREQQPNGTNQEEMIADFMNLQAQLIQAVDMLLEMKPEDDVATEAATAKIGSLTAISQLGAKEAMEQLSAFTAKLEQHSSEKISAFGREQSFLTMLNAYATDQVTDAQQVVDAFKKLAETLPKEGGLLTSGLRVASRLTEKGKNQEAAALLRYTAGLVEPTEDPKLHAAAEQLIEQAKFHEVDLRSKFAAAAERKDGAIEELTAALSELTSGETVGVVTLDTLRQIASAFEPEHADAAVKVYDVFEAALAKSSDPEVSEMFKEVIDKYRRRSAIVGKPFTLEGQLLDGTPFDWNQYKGKVVLVDFWATWCGPCLQEMPNIRANYEQYKERGFEVVGVNLDDNIEEFEGFSALQPLPWPSVLSPDPEAVGWDHPMAAKNGVAAIPFLVLVGRDGTAIALNTRGPALGEKLAELFPESASASEVPAATEPDKAPPATEKPPSADKESPADTPAAAAAEETADSPEAAPSE